MASEQSEAIQEGLVKRECITPAVGAAAATAAQPEAEADLPSIDIFVNPARRAELTSLADGLMKSAADFFTNADMRLLYPELFRILWQSTLPCVAGEGVEHAMIRSGIFRI